MGFFRLTKTEALNRLEEMRITNNSLVNQMKLAVKEGNYEKYRLLGKEFNVLNINAVKFAKRIESKFPELARS